MRNGQDNKLKQDEPWCEFDECIMKVGAPRFTPKTLIASIIESCMLVLCCIIIPRDITFEKRKC